jgi:hypothetical protein
MSEIDATTVAARIQQAVGCSKEMAAEYSRAMGQNPEVVRGKVVVRNAENRIIAYIPASVLNDSQARRPKAARQNYGAM